MKVMAKKELVTIKTQPTETGKVFILSQSVANLNEYEKAKAITKFINNETKVLETAIDTYIRQVLCDNGVIPQDGSDIALFKAFTELEIKGKKIDIFDRYSNIANETIVGESPNEMTVIIENDILSAAVEVIISG